MLKKQLMVLCSMSSLAILPTALLWATIVEKLDTAQLTKSSQQVVTGTVIDQESRWDADGKNILTYSKIEVDETVIGGLPKKSIITVEQPGGQIGDTTQKVHGITHLRRHENILLFLEESRDQAGGTLHKVTGMSQGIYRLRRNNQGTMMAFPVYNQNLSTLERDSYGKLRPVKTKGDALSLDELRRQIKQIKPGK